MMDRENLEKYFRIPAQCRGNINYRNSHDPTWEIIENHQNGQKRKGQILIFNF